MITAYLTGNFGNNLFGIVSSKCIAKDLGYEWGVNPHPEYDYHNGMIQTYFLDLDYGIFPKDITSTYEECCIRYNHDGDNVDIRTFDKNVYNIPDGTKLLGGVWQSYGYFEKHIPDIVNWLKIKPEYISEYENRLSNAGISLTENTCVINFRGGEYKYHPRLIIGSKYYHDSIRIMKETNPEMQFVIITDDVHTASSFLPGIPTYHFDIGMDYYILNNCHYSILSNSSFPIFAALTNQVSKRILAPKYWARHNVSTGYWAIGDQYYPQFEYVSREGLVESYETVKCSAELWRTQNGYK